MSYNKNGYKNNPYKNESDDPNYDGVLWFLVSILVILFLIIVFGVIYDSYKGENYQVFLDEIEEYNDEMLERAPVQQSAVYGIKLKVNQTQIEVDGKTISIDDRLTDIEVGDTVEYKEYKHREVTDEDKDNRHEDFNSGERVVIQSIKK